MNGLIKYNISEGIRQLVQIIVGCRIFSFPILYQIRCLMFRILFLTGKNLRVGYDVILHREHGNKNGKLKIGNDVLLSNEVSIDYSGVVEIENFVWVSAGVHIHTHKHPTELAERMRNHNKTEVSDLKVCEGAWLGEHSIILPNVHFIGRGSVVAAGSIVTKDVPENVVVAGNPAKIIRNL